MFSNALKSSVFFFFAIEYAFVFKVTNMQNQEALINDLLRVSKVS